MGPSGKEEDTLAMNVAAFFSSSPTTGDHLPAEILSASCVEFVDTMACSLFPEHARVGVDASPCFPSSSKADLLLSNGYSMSASPTSSASMSDSTSFPGTYTSVHAPVSPSSFSTCENEVGAAAGHAVFPNSHGALSTHVDNYADEALPARALGSGMLRHAFMCNYLSTLLPALRRIHNQSVSSSFDEKLSAVKLAADMSLAVSVGSSNTWSQALLKDVESSSACLPLLHAFKARSRRKPARKVLRKLNSSRSSVFSAMRKSARSRSIMHAWVVEKGNSVAGADGSSISSPTVNYLSDCSDGGVLAPQWSSISNKARQSWPHFLKPKKSLRRGGLYPYLRILRSTRSNKKLKCNKASSFTHDDASRDSSPAITKEHIESLGGLVPGGRSMDVPLLLQEAADYILSLQMQVEALQSLSQFVPS